ncbi:BapA prefix-like domain-containing protein, partial [Pseudomonas aeruginosa]|nr:BapA prefix-like domain-containing protein [Pseudomonas aeruginosa]
MVRPLGRCLTRGMSEMTIQAKVTSIDQSISSAAAVEIPENGIIHLSQSSNVALDVAPDAVAGYSKSGSDLIVQLKTGETVRIADFYAEGQPSSQLFLADKDQLVAVDLPPVCLLYTSDAADDL